MNLEKDTWEVISNYFETTDNYITKHHLDSFNDFTENKIYHIFNDKQSNPQYIALNDKENDDITYLIAIHYGGRNHDKFEISRPIIYDSLKEEVKPMYPNEARLKNLTYAFNVFCDIEIEYVVKEGETEILRTFNQVPFKQINIGRVPIMLHSSLCTLDKISKEGLKKFGECPYDQGGYFVIDGREKVCVSRERKSENVLYINKSSHPDYRYMAEVKSVPAQFRYARNTYLYVMDGTGEIMVDNPYFKAGKSDKGSRLIPLFVLFRALGVETDKEILEYIFHNLDDQFAQQGAEFLSPSFDNEDNQLIYDQMSALIYLEKFVKKMDTSDVGDIQRNRLKRLAILFKTIYDNLYPHVGNNLHEKALYLGYCVNQLLKVVLGIKNETDRDSFVFKRIDLSGFMIANLFRDGFQQLQYDCRNKISSDFEFGYNELKGDQIVNMVNENNIKLIFQPASTEKLVLTAFRTGTMSNPGGTSLKKGVIQQIDRRGYFTYMSQIRRLVTPNDTGTRVQLDQRRLHGTQYGYMCPIGIMDGSNVGIKKHFTCTTHITSGSPSDPLVQAIRDGGLIPLSDLHHTLFYKQTKVFLNGKWLGVHTQPDKLMEWMRLLRRNGLINIYVSVSWKVRDNEIVCLSDGGRCSRPLYIVEDNIHLITQKMIDDLKDHKINWKDLIVGSKKKTKKVPYVHNEYYPPKSVGYNSEDLYGELKKHSGVIEYLDNNEMENVMLSATVNLTSKYVDYTHSELHPSMILSPLAQAIPFPEHNQLPRNVYGIGQCKQAAAPYATNYMNRMETTAMVLSTPQKPLCNTRMGKYIFNDRLGHGQNIIVAVCSYTGYNQDDSIICCKDSIDLGLLRMSYYKGYEQTEKQDPKLGTFEYFYNPETHKDTDDLDDIQPKQYQDYSQLDKYGFIREGTYCKGKEILVGKYVKMAQGEDPPRDISLAVKGGGETVDKVFTCYVDDTKTRLVKIRTVKERLPELGDKIGSRYGQKGVLGITLHREEMPHTKNGLRPDIIINPGAFPKRMTNAQFIETVYGKLAAELGLVADGTGFIPKDIEAIGRKLEENGFEAYGTEVLYNGLDGKQIQANVFLGPVYYQRFKQMVGDKIHSRAAGSRNEEDLSTMGGGYTVRERQPYAGRALGGGGRIGEMERDAIISHGIMGFLKESVMERSDKYYAHICSKSGRIGIVNPTESLFISPDIDGPLSYNIAETLDVDGYYRHNNEFSRQQILGLNTYNQDQTEFFRAYMPYCAKLLIQECEGMGISIRLRSEASDLRPEVEKEKKDEMVQLSIADDGISMEAEREELESLKEYLKQKKKDDEELEQKGGEVELLDDLQEDQEGGYDPDPERTGVERLHEERSRLLEMAGGSRQEMIDSLRSEEGIDGTAEAIENSSNNLDLEMGVHPAPTSSSTGGLGYAPALPSVQLPPMAANQLGGGPTLDPIQTFQRPEVRPVIQEMQPYQSATQAPHNPENDVKIINLDSGYMNGMGGGGNAAQIEAEMNAQGSNGQGPGIDDYSPGADILGNLGQSTVESGNLEEVMGGASAVEQEMFI